MKFEIQLTEKQAKLYSLIKEEECKEIKTIECLEQTRKNYILINHNPYCNDKGSLKSLDAFIKSLIDYYNYYNFKTVKTIYDPLVGIIHTYNRYYIELNTIDDVLMLKAVYGYVGFLPFDVITIEQD